MRADARIAIVEAGVVLRDMTLENPIRAIREISHDVTGTVRVKLANGRELSALQIQTERHRLGTQSAQPVRYRRCQIQRSRVTRAEFGPGAVA